MSTIQDFFRNPPIIERTSYVEPHPFDFPYRGVSENDVPDYFKRIFTDPSINNEERRNFIDKFLLIFLTNKSYRKEVMGKFLLFVENKFEGVVSDESDAWFYGSDKTIKQIFYIGNRPAAFGTYTTKSVGSKRYIDNEETTRDVLITDKRRKTTKIKKFTTRSHYMCKISLSNHPVMDSKLLISGDIVVGNKEVIFDVGCQVSKFPIDELWSYEHAHFNENHYSHGNLLREWNLMVGLIVNDSMGVAGGGFIPIKKIYMNEPLYESIEGLNPVEMHEFWVTESPNSEQMILMGLDLIDQHTSGISLYGNRIMLKIENQRDELAHKKNFNEALYAVYLESVES